MRVLVVTNDLPPRVGGIQHYVDRLARGLVDAGDDVVLYGSTPRRSHIPSGAGTCQDHDAGAPYRVVRERTPVLLPTPLVRRHAADLVRSTAADVVVFGATVPLAFMGPSLHDRTGAPFVCWTHGLEVSAVRMPGSRPLLRRIGGDAGAITYVSQWCEDLLAPAFDTAGISELLPPAVDPTEYHRGVDGAAVRARHGLSGRPVVVCVSRLVERKGQDQLIRSLPELRRRVPDTALLVVGGGPHRDALGQLAAEAGVADHVVFAGMVDDAELPGYYAAGDVFAMPCRERRGGFEVEAFGIVFIQAQAVGVPVVAGDIGGVADAVGSGEDAGGVLIDGTDRGQVTDAVAGLLADRTRARRLGARGARRVAERFTWSARTAQLRRLLERVVEG